MVPFALHTSSRGFANLPDYQRALQNTQRNKYGNKQPGSGELGDSGEPGGSVVANFGSTLLLALAAQADPCFCPNPALHPLQPFLL